MSTPPRRRRNPDASDSGPGGGGWLPTIAIGLGVVIAGLGIGALVAVLMQRHPVKVTPVALVTSTPARPVPPTRIPAPVVIATLVPPHTPPPSPSPSPSPAVTPSAEPTVQSSLEPTPRETAVPTQKTSLEPTAKPTAERSSEAAAREPLVQSPRPVPGAGVVAAAAVTPTAARTTAAETPSRLLSPRPVESGTAVPAPAQTESEYDERASAVVRRYIDALVRGDEKTARAALGYQGALSEQAFIDPGARIVFVKVTRLDASNASVDCEIAAAKGHYYATYHVKAAAGGPYISEHDYIKV